MDPESTQPDFSLNELLEISRDFSVRGVPIETRASLRVIRQQTIAYMDQAQTLIADTIDECPLEPYQERMKGSLLDRATAPDLTPLLEQIDNVDRQHKPFRRYVLWSFGTALVTGWVLTLFLFASELSIAYGMALFVDPYVQARLPVEFSVLVIFLLGYFPVAILVGCVTKLLYRTICVPRLVALQDRIATTERVCREFKDTYKRIIDQL